MHIVPLLQDKLISIFWNMTAKKKEFVETQTENYECPTFYILKGTHQTGFCLCLVMSWTCAFSPACCSYLCQTFHLTDRIWQKRPRTSSVTSCCPEVTSWAILRTQPLQALPAGRALKPEALDDQGVVFVLSGDLTVLLNLSITTGTLDHTTQEKQIS